MCRFVKGKEGFTIVEVLAVSATMAVLFAMLGPKLGSGIEFAKDIECKNNMRQVASATVQFAADKRFLPTLDIPEDDFGSTSDEAFPVAESTEEGDCTVCTCGKKKCVCFGKNNNGHGNNEDGVDVSNPGASKDGEDTDPTVDDEIKATSTSTTTVAVTTTTTTTTTSTGEVVNKVYDNIYTSFIYYKSANTNDGQAKWQNYGQLFGEGYVDTPESFFCPSQKALVNTEPFYSSLHSWCSTTADSMYATSTDVNGREYGSYTFNPRVNKDGYRKYTKYAQLNRGAKFALMLDVMYDESQNCHYIEQNIHNDIVGKVVWNVVYSDLSAKASSSIEAELGQLDMTEFAEPTSESYNEALNDVDSGTDVTLTDSEVAEVTSATVTIDYSGIGDNDLCPCGSGKKYKQCHGK